MRRRRLSRSRVRSQRRFSKRRSSSGLSPRRLRRLQAAALVVSSAVRLAVVAEGLEAVDPVAALGSSDALRRRDLSAWRLGRNEFSGGGRVTSTGWQAKQLIRLLLATASV